jgi:hypothetical protein
MHLDDGTGEELAVAVRGQPGGDRVKCFLLSSKKIAAEEGSDQADRPIVLQKPVTKDALAQALHWLKNE